MPGHKYRSDSLSVLTSLEQGTSSKASQILMGLVPQNVTDIVLTRIPTYIRICYNDIADGLVKMASV